MDEMTLTLNNPLTEEEWDLIEDVDFDKTNSIEFHTKHGKTVKFVKCTDERTEDMISRQAVLSLAKDVILEGGAKHRCVDATEIELLPSAQPEQIRCKDCKHFWLGQCGLNGLTWSYDSFCSRAERLEE